MNKEVLENYKLWSTDGYFDENTKNELLGISLNEDEIFDRFYKGLEFGTGGLRGVIGAGLNRMNVYTVGKATQGICNYIIKTAGKENIKGVAVSYDSRKMSKEFAETVCLTMNANGFKSYLFETLMPTPVLSYATRVLNLNCGVMITASHNPKEYNGYKLFWSDGCQVPPPMDTEIIDYVNEIEDFRSIKTMDINEAKQKLLFNYMPSNVYEDFLQECLKLQKNAGFVKENGNKMSIVYTPLHGAGNLPVRELLSKAGFENVFVVKEQELPDSEFKSVPYPNPEDFKCYELAIRDAKQKNADLVIATDPDSDRIGVCAKNKQGEFELLSGNQTAALVLDYLLKNNSAKQNGAVVRTIVSTRIIDKIAQKYNQKVFEVLTGFKYIGQKIFEFERDNSYSYIFGMEESFGLLLGTHARDKDAVSACLIVCEMALYYKEKGLSLIDVLDELYKQYGYYHESSVSITLKGAKGMEIMKEMMTYVRENPLSEIAGYKVKKTYDYLTGNVIDYDLDKHSKSELPISDVFLYELENDAWTCIRPSGTEPKIKFYSGAKEKTSADSVKMQEKIIDMFYQTVKHFED